jgi:hypothetical protein
MKPSTKIVLAIVIILSIAYGVLSILSAGDGIPEEADEPQTETVAPAPTD